MARRRAERDPDFVYDDNGRIKYHPEIHENQFKSYTLHEIAYICANYGYGQRKRISMAVGRTEGAIASLVTKLRRDGEFEKYKEMGKAL